MIEAILAAVVVAQQALIALERRSAAVERQRLLSAVVAQSPAEFAALEAQANRPKPRPKKDDAEAGQWRPVGS